MSQSSLKILILGKDPQVGQEGATQLSAQGVDAASLAITDTRESDVAIANIAGSKKWDGLVLSKAVQDDNVWFERVLQVVKKSNPNIKLIQYKDRSDVPSAIERQFNVKLPLA
jgi:dTDP-4-dehydrorhamnose reductase